MVVDDLDIRWAHPGPDEANAILVVDPDAVLTCPRASERFEMIRGRGCKISQGDRAVQDLQLALRDSP